MRCTELHPPAHILTKEKCHQFEHKEDSRRTTYVSTVKKSWLKILAPVSVNYTTSLIPNNQVQAVQAATHTFLEISRPLQTDMLKQFVIS